MENCRELAEPVVVFRRAVSTVFFMADHSLGNSAMSALFAFTADHSAHLTFSESPGPRNPTRNRNRKSRAIVLTVVVSFSASWVNEKFNRTQLFVDTDHRTPLVTLREAGPCRPDDWPRLRAGGHLRFSG